MNPFRRRNAAGDSNGKGLETIPAPVDKQFALVEQAVPAKEFVTTSTADGEARQSAGASVQHGTGHQAPVLSVSAPQQPGNGHVAPTASASAQATAGPVNAEAPPQQSIPAPTAPVASRLSPSLVDAAVRLADGNRNSQPVISVRGLKKIYQMGDVEVAALQDISVDIFPGEVTAIMGPSGSGKSTLMNIIGCLDVPTEGTYQLDGTDVSKLNDDQLAAIRCKKIGFVFQSFNLLSRTTALANVELPLIYAGVGGGERSRRAKAALTLVGLGQRMDHKPNELSGGQQQRVAIARALINEPAMILADEPTGNLDSKTSVEIMELFQRLNVEQGITIVFVTHNSETADYCHRTIRVRDGLVEVDRRHRPVAGIYSDPAIKTRLAAAESASARQSVSTSTPTASTTSTPNTAASTPAAATTDTPTTAMSVTDAPTAGTQEAGQ